MSGLIEPLPRPAPLAELPTLRIRPLPRRHRTPPARAQHRATTRAMSPGVTRVVALDGPAAFPTQLAGIFTTGWPPAVIWNDSTELGETRDDAGYQGGP